MLPTNDINPPVNTILRLHPKLSGKIFKLDNFMFIDIRDELVQLLRRVRVVFLTTIKKKFRKKIPRKIRN